jgi:methionyl-tRNA formyltransferase
VAADRWRVLFLGQGPLGEHAYGRLVERGLQARLRVVAVCSNPGPEGTWWGSARIRELADRSSTRFIANTRRDDARLAQAATELAVNCLISVGHPWLLSQEVLDAIDEATAFNLHGGPLPRFGGFNGPSHAILEGATRFGATLHWMDALPDAGPVAFEEEFDIPMDATATSLHALTVQAGRRLFDRLLECLAHGRLPPRIPMPRAPIVYSRRALSVHREIYDMSNDVEVNRKARAFWFPPFEPAFCRSRGTKYYVVPPEALAGILRARAER